MYQIIVSEQISVSNFSDGEVLVKLPEPLKSENIIYIHKTLRSFNTELIKIILTLDLLKRSGANSIHMVLTYLPYMRQDRQNMPLESVSIKPVLECITKYTNLLYVLDPHFSQIEAIDNIISINPISDLNIIDTSQYTRLVAPDAGSVKKIQSILKPHQEVCYMHKFRPQAETSEIVSYVGEIENQNCLIIDDILASGGTLIQAAKVLRQNGAANIDAYITHGIVTKPINQNSISNLFITDSISQEIANVSVIQLHKPLLDYLNYKYDIIT